MLSRKSRFSRHSFPKTRARGTSFVWGTVILTNASAVVTSKKVLRRAVDRNRARRRVYTALAITRVSALVYIRKEALTTPLERIQADLSTLR